MYDNQYLTFCGGEKLKNLDILISITPDIAFRLELLAKRNGNLLSQYIISVLQKHIDEHFENNKNYFEKYFK